MRKAIVATWAFVLAGCTGLPSASPTPSPCAAGEASYACQVERYQNVSD